MKQETLTKGAEITKKIAAQAQRLSELDNLIKDRRGNSNRAITFESNNARVPIYDDRIVDIITAILQADFKEKLQKAEQELADLKD